jgi:hypothetical protein
MFLCVLVNEDVGEILTFEPPIIDFGKSFMLKTHT